MNVEHGEENIQVKPHAYAQMSGSYLREGFGVVKNICSRAKILSTTSKKSNSESSKTTTQEPLKGLRYQQPQPKKYEVSEA